MLSQIPELKAGEIERWVLSAAAVGGIALVAMRVFLRKRPLEAEFVTKEEFSSFRATVERELSGLRDRIDSRHLTVVEKLEQLKASLLCESERRDASLHRRLNEMEAGLARVDERTR